MGYISHETSTHFYAWDGLMASPAYDIKPAEAKKRGCFVSPTQLEKDIRYSRALDVWKQNQIIGAVLKIPPKLPQEDDKAYGRRVTEEVFRPSTTATDFGIRLHDVCAEYPQIPLESEIRPWFDLFAEWYTENIQSSHYVEQVVALPRIGVAGRTDLIAYHKIYGPCLLDWKTQGIKEGKTAAFYESWPRQLAFYREAAKFTLRLTDPIICISAVIDSTRPSKPVLNVWSEEEMKQAWKEFLCTAWLWFADKKYWPGVGGYWEPIFPLGGGLNAPELNREAKET